MMQSLMLIAGAAFVLSLMGAAVPYAMWLAAERAAVEDMRRRVSDYDERAM